MTLPSRAFRTEFLQQLNCRFPKHNRHLNRYLVKRSTGCDQFDTFNMQQVTALPSHHALHSLLQTGTPSRKTGGEHQEAVVPAHKGVAEISLRQGRITV